MGTDTSGFPGRDDAEVAEFLLGIRARQLKWAREPIESSSPWLVTAAAIVSGIILAALIITAAYLTSPLGR
jgi:hypothetical protein